jgi:hypothetical protein
MKGVGGGENLYIKPLRFRLIKPSTVCSPARAAQDKAVALQAQMKPVWAKLTFWRRLASFHAAIRGVALATASAAHELIGDEIEAPAVVRRRGGRHRRPGTKRPFAPAALLHFQPFLAINPEDALVVHLETLPPAHHVQPPVAEPPALSGDGDEPP